MLRITRQEELDRIVLRVEGKLVQPWIQELESCWRTCLQQTGADTTKPLVLDLKSVTFIGVEGKELLDRIYRSGAKLVTSGTLMNSVVEDLQVNSGSKGD